MSYETDNQRTKQQIYADRLAYLEAKRDTKMAEHLQLVLQADAVKTEYRKITQNIDLLKSELQRLEKAEQSQ